MSARTQADLRLQGIGPEKIPYSLTMNQTMNQHGYVKTVVWLTEEKASESERYVASGAYVILTTSEKDATPLFCGIIVGTRVFRKEGRFAAELELRSYTWMMDQNPKKVSFQQSGRTCQKLTERLLAPYHGIYTWDQLGKELATESFLMQYEETDWAFLCRMAAKQSYPVFPEDRGIAVEVCIGLPQNCEISELATDQYRIRSRMQGAWQEPDQPGCLVPSVEYLVEGVEEEIPFGDPVVFLQRQLWVVERNCYLKAGVLLYDYVLWAGESCRVESWQNGALSGAAVTATSAAKSRLSLVTDTGERLLLPGMCRGFIIPAVVPDTAAARKKAIHSTCISQHRRKRTAMSSAGQERIMRVSSRQPHQSCRVWKRRRQQPRRER